ncbi:MAG: sigma-54-dependent Fis family transcriptional regulator, partial [Cytophagales bacterium]|nr:sigma-54-dependent Fis family transcriptional regulator [Cytophagales bacterium]
VGDSPLMDNLQRDIDKIAPTEARVLITGANGTGKELVANALHSRSKRSSKPFVSVNCAAIPEQLVEKELFGHEKGAFTGAITSGKGKFEMAEGGTLFLDEIGDMPLGAQTKLLRALQERKITKVGGEKDIPVNVRVLAATNKDLRAEIKAGRFREDLYHRLSVVVVKVPSLKERSADIPLLVEHFLGEFSELYGNGYGISEKAMRLLQQQPWTGNIRELRNACERLCILGKNVIDSNDVEFHVAGSTSIRKEEFIDRSERQDSTFQISTTT